MQKMEILCDICGKPGVEASDMRRERVMDNDPNMGGSRRGDQQIVTARLQFTFQNYRLQSAGQGMRRAELCNECKGKLVKELAEQKIS